MTFAFRVVMLIVMATALVFHFMEPIGPLSLPPSALTCSASGAGQISWQGGTT